MLPAELLGKVETTDGQELALYQRAGIFEIRIGGYQLMSSRAHGSEEALARQVCQRLSASRPAVLIGGLGMGFTLRAALGVLPGQARVTVAEVFPKVVEWNRGPLAHLAGHPLADRRVRVFEGDVADCLRPAAWDAILLDIDNGPEALTLDSNHRLYADHGLDRLRRSLASGGILGVWSADPSPPFLKRLRRAGFEARQEKTRARGRSGGPRHYLFLARPQTPRDPGKLHRSHG